MGERRLFLLPGACLDSDPQPLPPKEAHHVAHVLRLRPGDVIGILDGCGREGTAEIANAAGGCVLVRVVALGPGEREPVRPVVVVAALVRGPRWDFLIEKATELGATHIAPFAAARSVVKGARLDRWRKVALAAAKQSLRARIPEVAAPLPLEGVLAAWPGALVLVASEEGGAIGAPPGPGERPLLLVVGPEGGLTGVESESLREAGARQVTLGPRRLRSETAVAGLLCLSRPFFDRPGHGPAREPLDTARGRGL